MNIVTIALTVEIDVDRKSEAYSQAAVEALDPTKKGMTSSMSRTLTDADADISKSIAYFAAQYLLNGPLSDKFGRSTVRIKSPKNLNDIPDYDEGDLKWTPN